MKKIFLKILVVLIPLLYLTSCTEDFKPVFNENASQRFQTAKSKYDDILKSSKNGWLLQYFPSKDLQYGGFNYYLTFLDNNKVNVSSELYKSATEAEQSDYIVKQEGGAILSFNTYNFIMDFFANPSAAEYKAKGGDFEFQIISYKDGVMLLQGLKTGNYMKLIKLNEVPVDYNKKVEDVVNFVDKGSLFGKLAGKPISINKNGRTLDITYQENGKETTQTVAFIYTDKGIKLYEPLNIDGQEYQDFNLAKEDVSLVSTNKKMEIKIVFPPIDFTTTLWSLDMSSDAERSAKIKKIWEKANADNLASVVKHPLDPEVLLGKLKDEIGLHVYSVSPSIGKIKSSYTFTNRGDINDKNNIYFVKGKPGFLWGYFFKHLNPVLEIFTENGPFSVEFDNEENPTKATFKSTTDPDIWFVLHKKEM